MNGTEFHDEAVAVANRLVQIAQSDDLDELRVDMIHETVKLELMAGRATELARLRAAVVAVALAEYLVEVADMVHAAKARAHERVLRRSAKVDEQLREREV